MAVGLGFLSAFKRGDIDGCIELLHPQVEWHQSPKLLDSDVLHGHDEVRQHLDGMHSRFANELEVVPEEGRQVGDHVLLVTLMRGVNEFTGEPIKSRECWVVSVRDDLWSRIVVYPNAPAAGLGFEELVRTSRDAKNPPNEQRSEVRIAPAMEAASPPAGQATAAAEPDAQAAGNTLTLTFTFEEAEALNRWLLKPAQDGALAADDGAVRPGLMKIRNAVEHSQAIAEVRRELEQAGIATQHLSDQQVAQLGRRISQAGPRLGSAAQAG